MSDTAMPPELLAHLESMSRNDLLRHMMTLQSVLCDVLAGDRVMCVFCEGQFARFLPHGSRSPVLASLGVVGAGYRPSAVCPKCFSLDRERLVYLFLRSKPSLLESDKKVLHVAPERCLGAKLRRCAALKYFTADLLMTGVTMRVDVTQLPCRTGAFDVAIANHVLEHVPSDELAISELYRVLRKPGIAILQVPISWDLRETLEDPCAPPEEKLVRFGQRDHVRLYGADYVTRLEIGGFSVNLYDVAADLGSDAVARYGLFPGEKLIIAVKEG